MTGDPFAAVRQVGPWRINRASGEIAGSGGMQRLEPKVMDLLCLLAGEPGRVWTRDELMEALWPGVVVGDDSLARTVSKLRTALGDDAKAPVWIETIAKRGYRWVGGADVNSTSIQVEERSDADQTTGHSSTTSVAVGVPATPGGRRIGWLRHFRFAAIGLIVLLLALQAWREDAPASAPPPPETAALLSRADGYYFQFTRADNEAALELYQRVLGLDPDDPAAMTGLANALAQRAIRWPTAPGPDAEEFTRLGDALAHGHLDREPARSQLERARQLADAAVARAPDSAAAWKARGLVASAQGRLDDGLAAHRRAVELDPDAWAAMINLADVLEQLGRADEALPWFERAHAAMTRDGDSDAAQLRRWQDALGVLIADRHRARGDLSAAETWYRRVLALAPLQPAATRGLAAVLAAGGDPAAARRMCAELEQRLGTDAACATDY